MFQIKVLEKIKTQIFSLNFLSKNRAVYEIISKNVVEPERPQMTPWRMRVSCWISKATHAQAHANALLRALSLTHTRARADSNAQRCHTEIYNTYCFSAATMVS